MKRIRNIIEIDYYTDERSEAAKARAAEYALGSLGHNGLIGGDVESFTEFEEAGNGGYRMLVPVVIEVDTNCLECAFQACTVEIAHDAGMVVVEQYEDEAVTV